MAPRKNTIRYFNFVEKIALPSAASARPVDDGSGRTESVSPFTSLVSIEQSYAVKIAVDRGVPFGTRPEFIQKNCRMSEAELKKLAVDEYRKYQAQGYFPEEFSPEDAAEQLKANVTSVVDSIGKSFGISSSKQR